MSEFIKTFTREVPDWKPRVKPVSLDEATEAQLDALKVTPSNTKVSDYVLTLAHDVESLKVRSPLFNSIMYDKGGLKRSERELGAIAASVLNSCIYCNAVHMSRHAQLEKDTSATDSILADGENAKLADRDSAIFQFSLKLSSCPPDVGNEDLIDLEEAGLKQDEVLDLILSTALFGWANRLMHILGDPVKPKIDNN